MYYGEKQVDGIPKCDPMQKCVKYHKNTHK